MKKICFFLLLITVTSFGQKAPAKFGEIPMEDMTMKVYPQDSSASAVVLFDYGVAYVTTAANNSGWSHYRYRAYTPVYPPSRLLIERHTRIKILKKGGLHNADIAIPLFTNGRTHETLDNLKAVTYNLEDGQMIETNLPQNGIFEEEFNKNFIVTKFTLPNVKEGSIIEYSYKINSGFIFNFPNWRFQSSVPTRLSEYWAMIPDFIFFEKFVQGYIPLTSYEKTLTSYYGEQVNAHHYVSTNVPAFKKEPYLTTEEDYVSKVNFALSHVKIFNSRVIELMGTWDKLAEVLRTSQYFGKAVTESDFLKDDVERIITGITDPTLKISAISNYLKKNFEWDGYKNFGVTSSLKNVIEKKKGSSGDLNILLGAMLNKAGFEVEMVLLSTRDHGFIRTAYPMERQFNYVVASVKIGEKLFFLDATEKYLPFDVLPTRCLNGTGLKIGPTFYNWIEIAPNAKEKTIVSTDLSLMDDGVLHGKINYDYHGYDARKVRADYISKGEEAYTKQFTSGKLWTVKKTEFQDMSEVGLPAKVAQEIAIDEHATKAGDIIYINPMISHRIEENPFKSEKREYPVDFGNKVEETYMCKITIPDGFAFDELPKSTVLVMPENAAKFYYNTVQLNSNTVNITCSFQVNKIIFSQPEYPDLREFYNQVIAKQAEQIVIKKK